MGEGGEGLRRQAGVIRRDLVENRVDLDRWGAFPAFTWLRRYGITAAAAVSTLGYFTCVLWSLLAFRKESSIRLSSLWVVTKEDWHWLKRQARNTNR